MNTIGCLYEGHEELCPYRRHQDSCNMTTHHTFYPKRLYRSGNLKHWREEESNKVKVCRGIHDILHLINYIPKRPSNNQMVGKAVKNEALESKSRD